MVIERERKVRGRETSREELRRGSEERGEEVNRQQEEGERWAESCGETGGEMGDRKSVV